MIREWIYDWLRRALGIDSDSALMLQEYATMARRISALQIEVNTLRQWLANMDSALVQHLEEPAAVSGGPAGVNTGGSIGGGGGVPPPSGSRQLAELLRAAKVPFPPPLKAAS
jgi:hypothetical protein